MTTVAVLGAAAWLLAASVWVTAPAWATITPSRVAFVVGQSMENPTTTQVLDSSAFTQITPDTTKNPSAISTSPLAPFPRIGDDYVILSSGDAVLADQTSVFPSVDNGVDPTDRGDTAEDVTVLRIDFDVPATSNCLSFDFRFLSEEYPEYVTSNYNDAFIAELDKTAWTTSGAEILNLDNNFATDPTGAPVTIKSTGATSMSPDEAAGTPYDGATAPLRAQTPITSGPHSVFLSIFDQSDSILDTAAFVDNLLLRSVANPAVECPRGSIALGPTVTIAEPAADSITDDSTPVISGTAGNDPGDDTTVTVRLYTTTVPEGTPYATLTATRVGGTWSVTPATALPDGTYTVQASQKDAEGITGLSGGRTFSVNAPPVVTIDNPLEGATVDVTTPTISGTSGADPGDSPTVTVTLYDGAVASGEPLQTLSATSDFGFFSVTAAPVYNGTYTAVATQTDDAGHQGTSPARSFTVSVPGNARPQQVVGGIAQQSPPSLPPPPPPPPSPLPGDKDGDGIPDDQDTSDGSVPPVPGKSVNVWVVSGEVFIKVPAGAGPRVAAGFVPLKGKAQIPIGSQLDTSKGRVALTSAATTAGAVQTSDFYAGIFQVKQTVPRRGTARATALTTDIVLKGRSSATACGPTKGGARAAAKRPPKTVLGELWGNGKGRFRTRGKHSAATVRGTIWLTQDRCDGTLTRVTRGTVRVEDFGRRRTVTVRAGQSYLARAQRAAAKSRKSKG